jgi:hypothetical protein
MGRRSSTPTNGAGKCARVSSVGAAREFGLHVGLHNMPPQHKLARCHAMHCRRQGLECAPSRVVQPNDAGSGSFFARKRGLGTERMALGHTAPGPDGAALRIPTHSRTLCKTPVYSKLAWSNALYCPPPAWEGAPSRGVQRASDWPGKSRSC